MAAALQVIEAALVDAKMDKTQIDWLVMHQANMRIMSAAADRLGVPPGASKPASWLCIGVCRVPGNTAVFGL